MRIIRLAELATGIGSLLLLAVLPFPPVANTWSATVIHSTVAIVTLALAWALRSRTAWIVRIALGFAVLYLCLDWRVPVLWFQWLTGHTGPVVLVDTTASGTYVIFSGFHRSFATGLYLAQIIVLLGTIREVRSSGYHTSLSS